MTAPVPTRRSNGRSERRIPQRLAAELSRPDESAPMEMTFTENVSPRGIRLTTMRRWQPGTRVLLTFPQNGIRSEGRIVYCKRDGSRWKLTQDKAISYIQDGTYVFLQSRKLGGIGLT